MTIYYMGKTIDEWIHDSVPQKLFRFATEKHKGQIRKYTSEPYIKHCENVSELLYRYTENKYIALAGLLHDILEDTDTTVQELERLSGSYITKLVQEVTDVSKPQDGNRSFRKKLDLEHISKASPEAKTIKLADLIDNSESILKFDPGFAKIYMNEKRELLEVLKEGNQELYHIAEKIVDEYFNE